MTPQELTKHGLILYLYINLSCHPYKDATVIKNKIDTIQKHFDSKSLN